MLSQSDIKQAFHSAPEGKISRKPTGASNVKRITPYDIKQDEVVSETIKVTSGKARICEYRVIEQHYPKHVIKLQQRKQHNLNWTTVNPFQSVQAALKCMYRIQAKLAFNDAPKKFRRIQRIESILQHKHEQGLSEKQARESYEFCKTHLSNQCL